jgi:hypothetical protein
MPTSNSLTGMEVDLRGYSALIEWHGRLGAAEADDVATGRGVMRRHRSGSHLLSDELGEALL